MIKHKTSNGRRIKNGGSILEDYLLRLTWPGGRGRLLDGFVRDSQSSSIILADLILGMNKDYGKMDGVITKSI